MNVRSTAGLSTRAASWAVYYAHQKPTLLLILGCLGSSWKMTLSAPGLIQGAPLCVTARNLRTVPGKPTSQRIRAPRRTWEKVTSLSIEDAEEFFWMDPRATWPWPPGYKGMIAAAGLWSSGTLAEQKVRVMAQGGGGFQARERRKNWFTQRVFGAAACRERTKIELVNCQKLKIGRKKLKNQNTKGFGV